MIPFLFVCTSQFCSSFYYFNLFSFLAYTDIGNLMSSDIWRSNPVETRVGKSGSLSKSCVWRAGYLQWCSAISYDTKTFDCSFSPWVDSDGNIEKYILGWRKNMKQRLSRKHKKYLLLHILILNGWFYITLKNLKMINFLLALK